MKYTLIILDKSLIHTIFDNECDLGLLKRIEKNIGIFILSDTMYITFYDKIISNKVHSVFQRDLWEKDLNKYISNYYSILTIINHNSGISIDRIKNDINEINIIIRKIIKSFNAGISKNDTYLIALSYYIRKYTCFEPIILSDDSDLLIHGQFISIYFGISYIFLSIYELLKLLNEEEILIEYMKNRGITKHSSINVLDEPKKNEFEQNIFDCCQKNLISFHPYVSKKDVFENIARCKLFLK